MLEKARDLIHVKRFFTKEFVPSIQYTIKWLVLAIFIGLLVGTASAFFLFGLEWATLFREEHVYMIALLPVGGFAIGWVYHKYGQSVVKGNNQLLEEFYNPLTMP